MSASQSVTDRWPLALKEAQGFRRAIYAIGLGGFGALAFEPFDIFPFLLLSYAGFVLMLDGAAEGDKRLKSAALIGWSYGFGFFLIGLHWIGFAFLVEPDQHLWQLPFAALAMPSGLALFFMAASMASMLLWRKGLSRIFVFATCVFVMEWLRGHIFTGFPWNLPGYGWAISPAILQSTAFIGVYGLSLLTLVFGASFAVVATGSRAGRAHFLPAAFALLFLAIWGAGAWRLANASDATVEGVHLRIVQPDTPQNEKYVSANLVRNWRRLVDLSNEPSETPPTHIIWPEAAPPFPIQLAPGAQSDIVSVTGGTRVLLTGDVRIENPNTPQARYFNSFDVIDASGNRISTYDKFHLVPFGEYLPFPELLRAIGFSEIAADTGFSSGPGPRTLEVPGAPPIGPLICYEVIFPLAVTGDARPGWFVNVTDDSWFGPNAGPMQHLLIARVRAIEEGIPIARAANSGISAVIDAQGRIRKSLALGLRGFIDVDLPVALPPTPYAEYGNVIVLLLVLLCASAALWPLILRRT